MVTFAWWVAQPGRRGTRTWAESGRVAAAVLLLSPALLVPTGMLVSQLLEALAEAHDVYSRLIATAFVITVGVSVLAHLRQPALAFKWGLLAAVPGMLLLLLLAGLARLVGPLDQPAVTNGLALGVGLTFGYVANAMVLAASSFDADYRDELDRVEYIMIVEEYLPYWVVTGLFIGGPLGICVGLGGGSLGASLVTAVAFALALALGLNLDQLLVRSATKLALRRAGVHRLMRRTWLDRMVERRILVRVGTEYSFIHLELRDHLAR